MNIELLLSEISGISKKYDLINQKTGGFFNIFEIVNIADDEVKICRVLHELLNPKGNHYQGDKYLRLFVKCVLNMDFCDSDYLTARVYREFPIENDRRIDLVICTAEKFIPIEVKIWADDQKDQCADYYNKAQGSNMFYLTPFGKAPSEYSAGKLQKQADGYKGVTQISFESEILTWLEKCLELQETVKIAPIREVLLQLIAVVRRFTNKIEEGKELEIQETLIKSKDNMKAAIEIEKSLKSPSVNQKVYHRDNLKVDHPKAAFSLLDSLNQSFACFP